MGRTDGTSSSKTMIFALGSAHGDDQIGWRVAERLAATIANAEVAVRTAGSAGQLLDCLEGIDRLIVCDACQNMGTIGRVHCWRWPEISFEALRSSGSHDLDLAGVLALGERLRLLPADVIIFGVEGESYLPGSPLPTHLEDAVDRVADAILRVLGPQAANKQV